MSLISVHWNCNSSRKLYFFSLECKIIPFKNVMICAVVMLNHVAWGSVTFLREKLPNMSMYNMRSIHTVQIVFFCILTLTGNDQKCVSWDVNHMSKNFRKRQQSIHSHFFRPAPPAAIRGQQSSLQAAAEGAGVACLEGWRVWWVVVHGDIIFHQILYLLAAPTGSSSRTDEVRRRRSRRTRRRRRFFHYHISPRGDRVWKDNISKKEVISQSEQHWTHRQSASDSCLVVKTCSRQGEGEYVTVKALYLTAPMNLFPPHINYSHSSASWIGCLITWAENCWSVTRSWVTSKTSQKQKKKIKNLLSVFPSWINVSPGCQDEIIMRHRSAALTAKLPNRRPRRSDTNWQHRRAAAGRSQTVSITRTWHSDGWYVTDGRSDVWASYRSSRVYVRTLRRLQLQFAVATVGTTSDPTPLFYTRLHTHTPLE